MLSCGSHPNSLSQKGSQRSSDEILERIKGNEEAQPLDCRNAGAGPVQKENSANQHQNLRKEPTQEVGVITMVVSKTICFCLRGSALL